MSELQPTLPRAAYLDREVWAAERERIFARQWVAVARDEDLDRPGAWRRVAPADEPLLLVRDADGELRAFANVCRHRGAELMPATGPAYGCVTGAIRCAYHGWTYGLDGSLRRAPFLDVDPQGLGLHAARVATWGGFVFVQQVPGPTLADQLGPVPARVSRYPLAELRRARRLVYQVAANWKVVAENYNECYHCGQVHPELCSLVPAFRQGGRDLAWPDGIPHRDGAWTFTTSGTTTRSPFPGLDEHERVRHKGELVYPNLLLSLSADHAAAFTLWPHGPDATTVVCDVLCHPDEIARPGFDPSDAVGFWDVVNRQDWAICESVQRGMGSRAFTRGWFAPMEDDSLDIARWYAALMGPEAP